MTKKDLEEILICKQIIAANEQRLDKICKRAIEISTTPKIDILNNLQGYVDEIEELRKEQTALNRAIRTAKIEISKLEASSAA